MKFDFKGFHFEVNEIPEWIEFYLEELRSNHIEEKNVEASKAILIDFFQTAQMFAKVKKFRETLQ